MDPLQTVQQLLLVKELKDYPRMLISLESKDMENFWFAEAEKLKSEVLK
jgi:hypothetical protein